MIARRLCAALAAAIAISAPAGAETMALTLPDGAVETARSTSAFAALRLPVGRWTDGHLPMLDLKGGVEEIAWRIDGASANTLVLVTALADQLAAKGFQPIFACATDDCGGFDFRYAAPILPEPEMHVDLGDFQYQLLIRGRGDQADYAALVTSRTGPTAFAELIFISQARALPVAAPIPAAPTVAAPAPAVLADRLEQDGHVVLDDLTFTSGSADLGLGPAASLRAIAAYLSAHPDARIAIVGHTDASGLAAANLDLSRARARSVMARLVSDYGAPPAQLSAEGVGPFAPLASNLTDEGRQKNRRVEAVLTSTR